MIISIVDGGILRACLLVPDSQWSSWWRGGEGSLCEDRVQLCSSGSCISLCIPTVLLDSGIYKKEERVILSITTRANSSLFSVLKQTILKREKALAYHWFEIRFELFPKKSSTDFLV